MLINRRFRGKLDAALDGADWKAWEDGLEEALHSGRSWKEAQVSFNRQGYFELYETSRNGAVVSRSLYCVKVGSARVLARVP